MDSLRFGTAGIPLSTEPRDMLHGIQQVNHLGLGAMEVEFVRSIHVSPDMAPTIRETARNHHVTLSCHGQYYINLNAHDNAIVRASINRIISAARIASQCGVWSLCYHFAYYLQQTPAVVYENVKKRVHRIIATLQDEGMTLWLRPETTGKTTQWGNFQEVIKLSQDVEQVLPCIDWAHLHARSNGKWNTADEFRHALTELEHALGREALDNMHMHLGGIEYTQRGERRHVNVQQSDVNYHDLMTVLKEFRVKGVAISESPNIEGDALLMRDVYQRM
jgi:deoxyribonuclease-4